jgi:hypothetical protein
MIDLYFTDFFDISEDILEEYGAFNISLINDVPLFVDPFLLFNSKRPEYRQLHDEIIRYVTFLRDKAASGSVDAGLLKRLFTFHEVKQNWFGFSIEGNKGSGLGAKFARSLYENLGGLFSDFGSEPGHKGHIEKLCLVESGVGKDNISDFTTTLIKGFLLKYTQEFARQHIHPSRRKTRVIDKVVFDYNTESWKYGTFDLPAFREDYVLLSPKDILTKDETWINQRELINRFDDIASGISNEELRSSLDNYLRKKLAQLPVKHGQEEERKVRLEILKHFPQMLDEYVHMKESSKNRATFISERKVRESHQFFVSQVKELARRLDAAGFYEVLPDTRAGALQRIALLRSVLTTDNGHLLLYFNGKPITREPELKAAFRILWFGRSRNSSSSAKSIETIPEAKLASNRQLAKNLAGESHQDTLKVVFYYTDDQHTAVQDTCPPTCCSPKPSGAT